MGDRIEEVSVQFSRDLCEELDLSHVKCRAKIQEKFRAAVSELMKEEREIPPVIIRALTTYREKCFDDSEYGIGIDAFLSNNKEGIEKAEKIFLEDLCEPEVAIPHIMSAKSKSMGAFLLAIRDVARSFQMTNVAKDSGKTREALYRAFSEDGNPTLKTFDAVLDAIGLDYEIVPKLARQSGVGA